MKTPKGSTTCCSLTADVSWSSTTSTTRAITPPSLSRERRSFPQGHLEGQVRAMARVDQGPAKASDREAPGKTRASVRVQGRARDSHLHLPTCLLLNNPYDQK
ncbi:uncharacterized protein LOC119582148 [Penaeus monodon]|uniref:uncharacterized protein LOC119582148 n=1 Tax=Penaeus monodon TaxID=6687 RepID=UPI0018A7443D|nr:uncharacterized protein LOC119582148 [Penaeus monodon]